MSLVPRCIALYSTDISSPCFIYGFVFVFLDRRGNMQKFHTWINVQGAIKWDDL